MLYGVLECRTLEPQPEERAALTWAAVKPVLCPNLLHQLEGCVLLVCAMRQRRPLKELITKMFYSSSGSCLLRKCALCFLFQLSHTSVFGFFRIQIWVFKNFAQSKRYAGVIFEIAYNGIFVIFGLVLADQSSLIVSFL